MGLCPRTLEFSIIFQIKFMVHYFLGLQVNKKSLETLAAKRVKKIPCMRKISIVIADSEMQGPVHKEQREASYS